MIRLSLPFALVLVGVSGFLVGRQGSCSTEKEITTGSLLREMIDPVYLTEFPDPPFKLVQFSSYDRRSQAPYRPGWFANSDGFGGEPVPDVLEVVEAPGPDGVGKYLLAKVEGPGALVRTWTAKIEGEIEVRLDGSAEPLYKGLADRFLWFTYSKLAIARGLLRKRIEEGFHQQEACYFPIPFAKKMEIFWTGRLEKTHFYQIEVRRYPEGTPVKTFSLEDLVTYGKEIDAVLDVLTTRGMNWEPSRPSETTREFSLTVGPDRLVDLCRLDGPSVVQEFSVRVQCRDAHRSLRGLVLKILFDGSPQPQVEAPLGDFFGAGPGVAPYTSLPMVVKPDGTMVCRFPMPFQQGAWFRIENLGPETVTLKGRVSTRPYRWSEDRSLHFFARWRVDHGLSVQGNAGVYDLPFLSARGKGLFVGTALMVRNPTRVPTRGGGWWGEGDEKIWVDDDPFPSLFGTGSEDYFNYAWSIPTLFHHAYFAQPLVTGPDNRGFTANNRWHILDPIPFRERIDFYMELFHHTPTKDLSYARIVYFYGTPSVRDDIRPIMPLDVTLGLDLPAGWTPEGKIGSEGASFFQAEEVLTGKPRGTVQVKEGELWSGGKVVDWSPNREGDSLSFELEIPETGRYQVFVTFVHSPDSGRVALSIDGEQPIERTADLYTPHLTILRNDWFLNRELTRGTHTFTLIANGKSAESRGTRIGVDFLWITPEY